MGAGFVVSIGISALVRASNTLVTSVSVSEVEI